MNVDAIREFCLAFPRATENLEWGDHLCFKIGGKIFVMLGLDNPRLCFKCAPERFAELIERQDIRPAPYVGRYKWVMLDRLDALPGDELQELIRQSHNMIAAKAPKLKRGKRKLSGPRKKERKKERKLKIKSSMAERLRLAGRLAVLGLEISARLLAYSSSFWCGNESSYCFVPCPPAILSVVSMDTHPATGEAVVV